MTPLERMIQRPNNIIMQNPLYNCFSRLGWYCLDLNGSRCQIVDERPTSVCLKLPARTAQGITALQWFSQEDFAGRFCFDPNDYNRELQLLAEYLSVYIQLLPFCMEVNPGDHGTLFKRQLPSFSYFKVTAEDPRYSLLIPHYMDADTGTSILPYKGIHSLTAVSLRMFNRWHGCKYFTSNNIQGHFTVLNHSK